MLKMFASLGVLALRKCDRSEGFAVPRLLGDGAFHVVCTTQPSARKGGVVAENPLKIGGDREPRTPLLGRHLVTPCQPLLQCAGDSLGVAAVEGHDASQPMFGSAERGINGGHCGFLKQLAWPVARLDPTSIKREQI